MPPENDDLRATLESAFEEHNSEEGRSAADTTQPVRTETEAPATRTEATPEDRGDGRRVDGKFARKVDDAVVPADAGKPAADPAAAPVAVAPVEAKPDPYAKAPQSWKPGAREAWQQLPPDVRAEVHRRERESARVIQETTQARQSHDYLGQLQRQFAPALHAEGVDVLTASANLMQLSSRLRFGTQQEKATLAAQIIRSYGVNVEALANVLDGQPVQQQPNQPMMDPRVDQLMAQLQNAQQERQQAVVQKAVSEVEQFGSDKEFFQDVREDMADVLEVAAKRGIDMTLEQAYDRACQLHPEIGKVVAGRAAALAAGTASQSTQRARVAASSVRGTPSGVSTNAPPDSLRAAIESAIDDSAGR